ncbi:MAG TPA: nitrilase-related carbon-nitrogen hydrolase [Candidatus Polarisedimenticolaceae bacterium]|nr:nitrilase-related carbon-nitrogen hydrolase [Candidatus Polarisedimenticolaceae bacterium]
MRLALVQQAAGPDKSDNVRRALTTLERAAAAGAELVCYAELSFERFYPQLPARAGFEQLAETIPGPLTDRFAAAAAEHRVVVVANLFERDGDRCYDTSPVIDADGSLLGRTRMVHITEYDCFHERGYYTPGDLGAPVFDTAVGKLGVAICYDRHYPEYMRALALGGAELVVVPQAGSVGEWPDGLYEAEMRVAAFHHGYHVALCNRVGREERLEFAGESFVCDPAGRIVARAAAGTDDLLLVDIEPGAAADSHARRLFLRDRRPELYGAWLGPRPR